MQLARFLNKLFKKGGFVLVDANSKKYIIGSPDKLNPITVKLFRKKTSLPIIILSRFVFWRSICKW